MSRAKEQSLILVEQIEPRIFSIRGQRVILDADLAGLYGVATKRLNEQVKRNSGRFPVDFAWQISAEEKSEVVANCDHLAALRFSHVLPFAFTEHGALMVASVLNTPRAVDVSVYVIRAFIKQRELLYTQKELAGKLAELEQKVSSHDDAIRSLVLAIRQLTQPSPAEPRKQIGFHVNPGDNP